MVQEEVNRDGPVPRNLMLDDYELRMWNGDIHKALDPWSISGVELGRCDVRNTGLAWQLKSAESPQEDYCQTEYKLTWLSHEVASKAYNHFAAKIVANLNNALNHVCCCLVSAISTKSVQRYIILLLAIYPSVFRIQQQGVDDEVHNIQAVLPNDINLLKNSQRIELWSDRDMTKFAGSGRAAPTCDAVQ